MRKLVGQHTVPVSLSTGCSDCCSIGRHHGCSCLFTPSLAFLSSLLGGVSRQGSRTAAMRAEPNLSINWPTTIFHFRMPVMTNVNQDIDFGNMTGNLDIRNLLYCNIDQTEFNFFCPYIIMDDGKNTFLSAIELAKLLMVN